MSKYDRAAPEKVLSRLGSTLSLESKVPQVVAKAGVKGVASIGQRLLRFLFIACKLGALLVRTERFKLAPRYRPNVISLFIMADDNDIRNGFSGGSDEQFSFRFRDLDRHMLAHGPRMYHAIVSVAERALPLGTVAKGAGMRPLSGALLSLVDASAMLGVVQSPT